MADESSRILARAIAARVWCDHAMRHVAMDVEAAEAIAKIVEQVRERAMKPAKLTAGECRKGLREAMLADPDYAWSWHCNIAVCAMEFGVDHPTANKIAARVMGHCFKVDTKTRCEREFKETEKANPVDLPAPRPLIEVNLLHRVLRLAFESGGRSYHRFDAAADLAASTVIANFPAHFATISPPAESAAPPVRRRFSAPLIPLPGSLGAFALDLSQGSVGEVVNEKLFVGDLTIIGDRVEVALAGGKWHEIGRFSQPDANPVD